MATNERAVQASSATHSPGHASRAACMTDAACGAACASAGAAGRNGEPALASLGHVRRAHTATLALGTSAAPPLRPPRRT
ncbi:hypothetical protein [Trinickia caryophylli]|nr:hypothetical protein [Trinickia caryophylli]